MYRAMHSRIEQKGVWHEEIITKAGILWFETFFIIDIDTLNIFFQVFGLKTM